MTLFKHQTGKWMPLLIALCFSTIGVEFITNPTKCKFVQKNVARYHGLGSCLEAISTHVI